MKFRLTSILWLTLAIACFFGGMSWNGFSGAPGSASMEIGASVELSPQSGRPIARATINDPNIATVQIMSPFAIDLTGASYGKTRLSMWDDHGRRTDYRITVEPRFPVHFNGMTMKSGAIVMFPK